MHKSKKQGSRKAAYQIHQLDGAVHDGTPQEGKEAHCWNRKKIINLKIITYLESEEVLDCIFLLK